MWLTAGLGCALEERHLFRSANPTNRWLRRVKPSIPDQYIDPVGQPGRATPRSTFSTSLPPSFVPSLPSLTQAGTVASSAELSTEMKPEAYTCPTRLLRGFSFRLADCRSAHKVDKISTSEPQSAHRHPS
ncbi:hypothetical protein PGT21_028753 [Puccinia graminis f. sp. tritici]|uniref:Uncharacterized protein n=1 Tax=Puccinia graminis f. sp. tritici TaxID=56615 RepID=A0A5B0MPE7_PUCGR|nr:hypothetical protein PGT21_028753 [Puccinia graminis f. sp. tritici]